MVCCIPDCRPAETSGGLVRVVKFPIEQDLRKRWLQAIEVGTGTALDEDPDYQLCTDHFEWVGNGTGENEHEYREPTVFDGGRNVASCRLCHQFQPVCRMVPSVGGGKFVDMALDTVVALVLRITLKPTDFLRMICEECLVKVDLIRVVQEQFALQQDFYGGYLGKVKPKLEIEEVEYNPEMVSELLEDDWKQDDEEDENEEKSDEESESEQSDSDPFVEVVFKKKRAKRKAAPVPRFRSKTALKSHENSKHGAKHKLKEEVARECQCHECGRVYSDETPTIKRKSKPEPQTWTCPTCGKQFCNKQNLQRHEKAVHLGERNYQCDLCPKAFSTATVLQNHRRCVHTGEALHECPGCGQRFKENGSFYRHRAKCAPDASKKAAAAKQS